MPGSVTSRSTTDGRQKRAASPPPPPTRPPRARTRRRRASSAAEAAATGRRRRRGCGGWWLRSGAAACSWLTCGCGRRPQIRRPLSVRYAGPTWKRRTRGSLDSGWPVSRVTTAARRRRAGPIAASIRPARGSGRGAGRGARAGRRGRAGGRPARASGPPVPPSPATRSWSPSSIPAGIRTRRSRSAATRPVRARAGPPHDSRSSGWAAPSGLDPEDAGGRDLRDLA